MAQKGQKAGQDKDEKHNTSKNPLNQEAKRKDITKMKTIII